MPQEFVIGTCVRICTGETGRILPWTKRQPRREEMPDFYRICFDVDGAQLLAHRNALAPL